MIFLHQSLLLQMDNTTACNNMECMHSFDHCEINHLSLLCYLQMSTQMSDISKQYFIQLRQALRPSLMFDKKQGEHPPWEIFATQKDLDLTWYTIWPIWSRAVWQLALGLCVGATGGGGGWAANVWLWLTPVRDLKLSSVWNESSC